MLYADYTYYSVTYGGKQSAADYAFVGPLATAFIASATYDRVTDAVLADDTTGRAVKMCCCVIADEYHKELAQEGKTSEKVGNYSVSYAEITTETLDNKLRYLTSLYLSRYGLLYRGCD